MKTAIILPVLVSAGLTAAYELISKRPLRRDEWKPSNQPGGCPQYLEMGEFEFPHYITQISAAEPDRSFGPQYFGVFTPNDVSSVFSFDVPAARAGANCTLVFLFPHLGDLHTSSFRYFGGGTFEFTGYSPGSCPGPYTTYNNQPAPGPFPAFPPVHMEPGNVYVIDVGPCFVGAGTCVAGSELGIPGTCTGSST